MRGKLIPVKAKKRIEGIFEVGDELFVQTVLYDKPKFLHGALGGAFLEDGTLVAMHAYPEVMDKEVGEKVMMDDITKNGQYLVKMFEESYAPAGSFSHCIIITADGKEYSDNILGRRRLDYAFDKM